MLILTKGEPCRLNLMSCCDIMSDLVSIKNAFSGIMYKDLFIFDVETNLC